METLVALRDPDDLLDLAQFIERNVAGNRVTIGRHLHGRALLVALLAELSRATRCERATLRGIEHARQVALEDDLAFGDLGIRDRHRGEQRLGVRVIGWREDLVGGAALHDLTEVHHHDSVGQVPDHAEIVADEKQGGLLLALDLHQQLGHRRRHRHVEGRDRLVGDDHGRIAGERAGDTDALLLSSGQLAWPPQVEIPRQLHDVEELHHPIADLRFVGLDAEFLDHAPDLSTDGVTGIQRIERILEHHLQRADLLRRARAHRDLGDVASLVTHCACGRGLEPHQDLGECDLQQPDSPTIATVSPRRALKSRDSFALTYLTLSPEPFYVGLVKLFVALAGGREVGILLQSFFFSIAVLPLAFMLAVPAVGRWWAAAMLVPLVLHEWLIFEAPSGYRISAYVFFLILFAASVFGRYRGRSVLRGVVSGILAAIICLIRLSALSFVLPILLLGAWEKRKQGGWSTLGVAALTTALLVAPFLVNCYRTHGDPFYAISFHTQFWLRAEGTESPASLGQVSLYRYVTEFHGIGELVWGNLRGLTVLPLTKFWNGLSDFPVLDTAVLAAGVAGLLLSVVTPLRFLLVAYLAHLIPFAYIQNFPSGRAPRFVMPAYFFLVLAAVWIGYFLVERRKRLAD